MDQNTIEAAGRLENLEELRNVLVDFETQNPEGGLQDFLQETSLATDFDKANPELSVQMMTLHSAKGLEFPYVFILGMEEGVFPSKMAIDFAGEDDVDEERRLFYVGITRAEKLLSLTYAKVRRVYGRLQVQRGSRFLSEIPKLKVSLNDHSEESPRRSWGSGNEYDSSDERSYYSDTSHATTSYASDGFEQVYDDEYKVGKLVEHPDFGKGVIKSRTGSGEATKVQIEFKGYGVRKFLTKFAKLRVLESGQL